MNDKAVIRKALEMAFDEAIGKLGLEALKSTSLFPLTLRKAASMKIAA